jgi:hypothetical protein
MTDQLDLMDSSRNFRSIRIIIFVNSRRSIIIIEFERRHESFTLRTKIRFLEQNPDQEFLKENESMQRDEM